MKSRKYIFLILTLAWVAVIFSFSLQPATVSDGTSLSFLHKMVKIFVPWWLDELENITTTQLIILNVIVRKCAHFAEYFILGILTTTTMLHMKWKHQWLYSIGFCVGIACIDEFLQLFVSGRSGRVTDVMIDSAGALVGIIIVYLVVRIMSGYEKKSVDWVE